MLANAVDGACSAPAAPPAMPTMCTQLHSQHCAPETPHVLCYCENTTSEEGSYSKHTLRLH